MNKKLSLVLAAMLCITYSNANAQRSVGARTVMLDDGVNHTLTLQTPTPMAGNSTFTFTPGGTGVASGTIDGQTLRWNNGTSLWETSGSLLNLNTATQGLQIQNSQTVTGQTI